MKSKGLLILSAMLSVAMVVFAMIASARLPDGATLPVHWNLMGEIDRFAPAFEALIIPPILLMVVAFLFALIPSLEPMQKRLEGSAPVLRITWIGIMLMMVVIEAAIGLPAFGIATSVNLILLAVGVLFLMIGNAMPKSRPGFFVGIRTPWTLSDTDNWVATHRLAGRLMMLTGLAIFIAGVLSLRPEALMIVGSVCVLITVALPVAYSWWMWRTAAKAS
ncbi:MAG: SdpI family protein [Maritimibacter sp.]